MAWMDAFRDLILETSPADDACDCLRRADPMRWVVSPPADSA